ncbi:MAG: hypothetical protein AAFY73_03905 [Pseudomonadota bacterium]
MSQFDTVRAMSTRSDTPSASAEYIADILDQLQKLAADQRHQALSYLISLAKHEAQEIVMRGGESAGMDSPSSLSEIDEREYTIDWWREQLDMLNDQDV